MTMTPTKKRTRIAANKAAATHISSKWRGMSPDRVSVGVTTAKITGKFSSDIIRSHGSKAWDQTEKGYSIDAERHAKSCMDVEGKGYISREQATSFGSQLICLEEDNKQIKEQFYWYYR
jgi:hypothetical protein